MGTVQIVQHVPDGLTDTPGGKAQSPGLHSQALKAEGDVDPLAPGVDGLAPRPVHPAGDQVRLHSVVQRGIGGYRINHGTHPTKKWYHHTMWFPALQAFKQPGACQGGGKGV